MGCRIYVAYVKQMSGYALWYVLRPHDTLHEQFAKYNEEMGDFPNLPARIPILENLKSLETTFVLFHCYMKKKKPVFRLERPIVMNSDRTIGMKTLSIVARSENGLHELPITSRRDMFFSHDVKKINIDRTHIFPGDYELVIYDCRTRDRSLWKPLHSSNY